MTGKIQLTPAELKAQAAEMSALSAEYEMLFSGVSSSLKNVNSNWSANLSRNFEGKITSAQNAFKGMTENLTQGATIATTSANTFESVDSLLAKLDLSDITKNPVISDIIDEAGDLWDEIKDVKSIGELFALLEQTANDNINSEVQEIIKLAIPDSLEAIYNAVSGLAQGELTGDNIYEVAKELASKNPYISGVVEAFKYTFEKGLERDAEMMASIEEQLAEMDILGVGFEMAEGYIDIILGGSIECVCSVAGTTVDGIIGDIPFANALNHGIEYMTGLMTGGEGATIGDFIGYGGDAISAGIDFATDVITDVTDVVTSAATSGVKKVASWIGSLFG